MALTFDQWKLGYGLTLIEEIAKECSVQVLVKVMLECQMAKAIVTDNNVTWLSWVYSAYNRWAEGEHCLDEIDTIQHAFDEADGEHSYETADYVALYMLCSFPDISYDERIVVDGGTKLTKKSIVTGWLSFHGITGDMIRGVMPHPPKNPDQEYCIIDQTLVGCCNLFEQSEAIQCKWDAKKSFYGG